MKKRFRYYARHGWDVVEVKRANLYKLQEYDGEFGNLRHYEEMLTWCHTLCPKDTWQATIYPTTGTKKFAFKEGKFATMFRLKWAT